MWTWNKILMTRREIPQESQKCPYCSSPHRRRWKKNMTSKHIPNIWISRTHQPMMRVQRLKHLKRGQTRKKVPTDWEEMLFSPIRQHILYTFHVNSRPLFLASRRKIKSLRDSNLRMTHCGWTHSYVPPHTGWSKSTKPLFFPLNHERAKQNNQRMSFYIWIRKKTWFLLLLL